MQQSLGVYISVPFCRAKCSYCNFASGVFGTDRIDGYIDRLTREIAGAKENAARLGAQLPGEVDSVYLGGGTPSLLEAPQLGRIFDALRTHFDLMEGAEVTLECAPKQLTDETLAEFQLQGGTRISLGVQSFVDQESRAVGRLHTGQSCLAEIERLRAGGVTNINVDLIVGLPHQTEASWSESVETALGTSVPHISVYMLEVDEDSRLGREMLASGERYGAGKAPGAEDVVEWYGAACRRLDAAGIEQYEISNFARPGFASRHNMKYWRRDPYLGFGLDAHSMLRTDGPEAVRWANPDDLGRYTEGAEPGDLGLRILRNPVEHDRVGRPDAFEESVFLGLRMNDGVRLDELRAEFGAGLVGRLLSSVSDVEDAGLLERSDGFLRLTAAGRIVSNEVFGRLLIEAP